MKNRNLLIVSLLIVSIVLGSYLIYIKTKPSSLIIGDTTTTITNPSTLTLCSNQYYDTEFDTDGKIKIKDFGNTERIKCSQQDLEPSPFSGQDNCHFKKYDIHYLLGLTCLQKLDYTGNNFLEAQDIPLLSQFTNLEYFESYGNSCENLFKTLGNLTKLKSIIVNCVLENTEFMTELINLEILHVVLQESITQGIDFKNIPTSIKDLSFYDYDNGNYKITNINQIINLTSLEKFS